MAAPDKLNEGHVGWAIFRVSAPMSVGILGVLLVGLADSFFLARYGGHALTAVGFIYPVIITLTSLSIGLSAGTSSVVSNALGRGEEDDKQRLTLHAMLIGLAAACAVAGLFWMAAPALFGLMGADGKVLEAVMAYVPWWCLSFPFLVMSMSLNSTFRAEGRAKVAAAVMLGQAVLNIGLTPLLIFGWGPVPELGVAGAGMATFVARLLAFGAIAAYGYHNEAICLNVPIRRDFGDSARRILSVSGPASLSNAINPGGMAAVTAAVAIVGDTAVAGFGAATRVQSLLFLPMLALSAGIGPVVGQAWGADKQDRARKAMRLTFLFCLGYGLLVAAGLVFGAAPIARWMTADDGAADFAASYLRIVGVSFFGYGILVTANAAMNARDRALWSMTLSASRIALVYIPLAWAGVYAFGFAGILGAAVLANVMAAWGAVVACRSVGLLSLDTAIVRGPSQRLQRIMPDAA